MKKLRALNLAGTALIVVATSQTTAFAQSVDAEVTDNEEIVVTATKRSESILDVPLAVSVLDAAELDQKNAGGFADYLTSIPGVQFNPAGNVFGNSISIRGVTDGTSSFLTQQPVALYLDETALTLSQGAINLDYSLFGVEQINVIKGPNSTLYGASSLGGTIKVITQKPSLTETRGRAKAIVSSTKSSDLSYSLVGSASVPLVENVIGAEVTGYYIKKGGTFDDPSRNRENINGSETYGARLAVRLQPTEALTIDLTGYYQKLDGDGLDTFAPDTVGDLQSRPLLTDQFQKDRFALGTVVIDYDFGSANLISATSYYDRNTQTRLDISFSFFNLGLPGAPIDILTSDTGAAAKVFSQELRLVSSSDGPFKWLVGGYYSKEDYSETIGITDPVFGPLFNGTLKYEYRTLAGFAELGYDITDRLNLTVGGRYTDYKTPVDFNLFGLFTNPATATLQRSDKDNDFSPRIALNYKYDGGSIYAQASKGFRLGQANVPIVTLPGESFPAFFGSDSLWNYEIGAKTRWLDNRLQINVAAYQIDWKDIQLTRTAGTGFTFIDNVGEARIRGFELEAIAKPGPNTTFGLNFGYIDGELRRTIPGVAVAGTRTPGSPEFTVSMNAQQDFKIGNNDAFLRADYLYYGPYDDAFVFTGRPLENGDYSKLDLRAGVTLSNIDVSIFATNLLDQRPTITRATAFGEEKTSIQPRTFGASLGFKF
jgi:iron complex outermembrane receptor protein